MTRLIIAGLIWASAVPLWGAAEHSVLLPRPRQVTYGAGRLPLRGLSIRFASNPSDEDCFAAQELSSFLSKAAGGPVGISRPSGVRAVTLERTGAVDALAAPGENTRPESRESFSLKISPAGAELGAPVLWSADTSPTG
jgi:hypothetical protein